MAVIKGIEASGSRGVFAQLLVLLLIPVGLNLIGLNLALLGDGAGKSLGVAGLLGDLDVLDDDRWVVASLKVHAREGTVVVPQRLNDLDESNVLGLG